MPPVKRAAIDTPVTEPMVISTRLGGMVSVCAPVRKQRDQVAGLGAALLHLREQHRATAAMSAAFEPEMPETRYIAPIST